MISSPGQSGDLHGQSSASTGISSSLHQSHSLFPAGQLVPFILVTALFFLWGIPNNLNPVLIRHFMKTFEITRFQAGFRGIRFLHRLFRFCNAGGPSHAPLRVQIWIRHRFIAFCSGFFFVLAGGAGRELWIFSLQSFCNRQRSFFLGDCFEPFYRSTGRSGYVRKAPEFFAGFLTRSALSAAL